MKLLIGRRICGLCKGRDDSEALCRAQYNRGADAFTEDAKTMTIRITPAARSRMQEFLARQPGAAGVRFGAHPSGCSGYSYSVDIAETVGADDRVFEVDGVRLVVDAKSLPLLDGTEIDFRRQGLNAAFAFDNPNATGACGCGESFTVGAQD